MKRGHGVTATVEGQSFALREPVELQPVSIAKPWGRELWYSGSEARGESLVRQGEATLPLSHYLALAPNALCRRSLPLLLKVLDPLPEPVRGDLYLETHDTKHEVYVVTHVDPVAWPTGQGGVRLGMDQSLRAVYASDDEFRSAFLAAVQAYEQVRRAIDAGDAGASTRTQEAELRGAMNAFTAMRELAVGDVVQVEPGLPHALQHGVRVFEFQTPTYERNIISFAQQVLTQSHWDSAYAIGNATMESAPEPAFEPVHQATGLVAERIANFNDFEVQRLTIDPGNETRLDWYSDETPYAMVAACSGRLRLDALTLDADGAAFIPGCAPPCTLYNPTSAQQTALLALPHPHTAGTIGVIEDND